MWYPGILKQVKDHIKACGQCQSKRGTDDVSGFRLVSRSDRAKEVASDEEEEEETDFLFPADSSPQPIVKVSKTATKHELVFVRYNIFKDVIITKIDSSDLYYKSVLIVPCFSSLGRQQG